MRSITWLKNLAWIAPVLAILSTASAPAQHAPAATDHDQDHAPAAVGHAAPGTSKSQPSAAKRTPGGTTPAFSQNPTKSASAAGSRGSASSAASRKPTAPAAAPAPVESPTPTPAEAMELLVEGNSRWVEEQSMNPHDERARREELARAGQKPAATILTCADSRIPAERVFDCGVGDIFVVRVAGNVMGPSETGTIEYGIEHLKTPLLVVMGHSQCGAVKAACTHAHVEGSITTIVERITPAVERATRLHPGVEGDALLAEAVRENVWQSIFDLLKSSDIARRMTREGELKIIGAVCDISTGNVEFLGEHPWQSELIAALDAQSSPMREQPAEAMTQAETTEH